MAGGLAGNHGTHAGSEAGADDHGDVNDEEEDEGVGDEEVQGARGLAATEDIDGEGYGGVEGGREGKAGPDDEGEEDENDDEIGDALEGVVGGGLGFGGLAAEMLCDDRAEGLPVSIGGRWEEVLAEVAGPEDVDRVNEAGEHEQPGGLEVEIAAPAVLVGHDEAVARGDGAARGGDGDGEEGLGHHVAGFAPVETGVRDEDLQAGEEQGKKGEDSDPVRGADERGVAWSVRIVERAGG